MALVAKTFSNFTVTSGAERTVCSLSPAGPTNGDLYVLGLTIPASLAGTLYVDIWTKTTDAAIARIKRFKFTNPSGTVLLNDTDMGQGAGNPLTVQSFPVVSMCGTATYVVKATISAGSVDIGNIVWMVARATPYLTTGAQQNHTIPGADNVVFSYNAKALWELIMTAVIPTGMGTNNLDIIPRIRRLNSDGMYNVPECLTLAFIEDRLQQWDPDTDLYVLTDAPTGGTLAVQFDALVTAGNNDGTLGYNPPDNEGNIRVYGACGIAVSNVYFQIWKVV